MKMGALEKLLVNSAAHSRRVSRKADRMLRRVPFTAGQHYLDVGCGNGIAPIYLALKHGLEITGVDVDRAQIRAAKKNAWDVKGARFITVDGTRLPFKDGTFDIVATNKVTHHIPDWETALAEMLRVLKPHGFFLYADLVWPSWLSKLGRSGPTRASLDSFISRQPLAPIHRSRSWVRYEAICRRALA